MSLKLYEESDVSAIADAIREKGVEGQFKMADMADAIMSISGGGGTDSPVLKARSDESEAVNTHYHVFNELSMDNEYFEYDDTNLYFVAKKDFNGYILLYMTSLGFTYKGHGALFINGSNKLNLQTSAGVQWAPAIGYLKVAIKTGDTFYYGRSSSTGASAIGVNIYDYDAVKSTGIIPIWTVPKSWFGNFD